MDGLLPSPAPQSKTYGVCAIIPGRSTPSWEGCGSERADDIFIACASRRAAARKIAVDTGPRAGRYGGSIGRNDDVSTA